jgi:hypothetical protein
MEQKILDVMRALSAWLDNEPHRQDCMFGHVVQSGPAEGNKIPCSCGLLDLQKAVELAENL